MWRLFRKKIKSISIHYRGVFALIVRDWQATQYKQLAPPFCVAVGINQPRQVVYVIYAQLMANLPQEHINAKVTNLFHSKTFD